MDERCRCGHSRDDHHPGAECFTAECRCRYFVPETPDSPAPQPLREESYFWASETWRGRWTIVEPAQLTAKARQGLVWARAIADSRGMDWVPGNPFPPTLSVEEFVESVNRGDVMFSWRGLTDDDLDTDTVREYANLARREIFGALTDSGIRARARAADREPPRLPPVKCEGCGREIAHPKTRRRRYCPGSSRCRVAGFRKRSAA
jgi:hypothetical protein